MEGENTLFVVRPSIYARCLELWRSEDFKRETDRLQEKLNIYQPEQRALLRKLQAANEVEMDASDRIVIPAEQRAVLGDGKSLVLQPVADWIEIWDYDTYERETNNETTDFVGLAIKYLGGEDGEGCNTKES